MPGKSSKLKRARPRRFGLRLPATIALDLAALGKTHNEAAQIALAALRSLETKGYTFHSESGTVEKPSRPMALSDITNMMRKIKRGEAGRIVYENSPRILLEVLKFASG